MRVCTAASRAIDPAVSPGLRSDNVRYHSSELFIDNAIVLSNNMKYSNEYIIMRESHIMM